MKKILPSIALVWVATLTIFSPNALALKSTDMCAAHETIFVRGSGDGSQQGVASKKFLDSLRALLNTENDTDILHHYDLGTEEYNDFKYPHIGINGSLGNLQNASGAFMTNGEGFDYGKSVDQGVGELTAYLQQRMEKCGDADYIVGGYSQGAQVVGDTLFRLTFEQREKISYVALFGDPKLSLPEGASHFFSDKLIEDERKKDPFFIPTSDYPPDACYGYGLSPWRHTIDSCLANKGRLFTERTPFVPPGISMRVHEWCFSNDSICNSSLSTMDTEGHGKYTDTRGIATAVAEALHKDIAEDNAATQLLQNTLAGKVDIRVYADWDCTVGLPQQFTYLDPLYHVYQSSDWASGRITTIGNAIFTPPDYSYATVSSNIQNNQNMWDSGDWKAHRPDAVLLKLVYTTTLCKPWSDLLMKYGASSLRAMAQAAPFTSLDTTEGITRIITLPSDTATLTSSPDTAIAFTASPTAQPNPLEALLIPQTFTIELANSNYLALTNNSLTFSLTQYPDTANAFEWDFDGDNIYEDQSSTPSVQHTYSHPFSGTVHVRARNSLGATGITSASVNVSDTFTKAPLPAAPRSVSIKKTSSSSVELAWSPDGLDPSYWVVRSNGFPLGYVTGSQHSIPITEVEFDKPVTYSVSGMTSNMVEGEPTSATIELNNSTESPDLSRTGSDVALLLSAYELHHSIPERKIDLPSSVAVNATTRQSPVSPLKAATDIRETSSHHQISYVNQITLIGTTVLILTGIIIFIRRL